MPLTHPHPHPHVHQQTCPAPIRRPSVTSVIAIRGCWNARRGSSLLSLPRTAGSVVKHRGATHPRQSRANPRNPLHAKVTVVTRRPMERAVSSFPCAMYLVQRGGSGGRSPAEILQNKFSHNAYFVSYQSGGIVKVPRACAMSYVIVTTRTSANEVGFSPPRPVCVCLLFASKRYRWVFLHRAMHQPDSSGGFNSQRRPEACAGPTNAA